jgi:hypothetical protein
MLEKRDRMRTRFSAGIGIIVAVGLLTGFQADALRANWKYAGKALSEKKNGRTLAFYDAENVEYLSNGDVKVRVMTIDATEIDDLVARGKNIMKKAAEKTAQSYYAHFLTNPDPGAVADGYIEMILWEEAANHHDMKPKSRRFYELNCKEMKIQTVSEITYKRDGTTTFTSDFDRWPPITTGSTGDALHRILCK